MHWGLHAATPGAALGSSLTSVHVLGKRGKGGGKLL